MDSREYQHALFFANQSVEKALKALVVRETKKIPPRTHNLVRLAELANIPLDEEFTRVLGRIREYNLEARYPDVDHEGFKEERSQRNFEEARECLASLMSQL